jgi:hypothetical protein
MPFLHWETDRRREKSAEVIRNTRKHKLSTMVDVIETVRSVDPQKMDKKLPNGIDNTMDSVDQRQRNQQHGKSLWKRHRGMGKQNCKAMKKEKSEEEHRRECLGRLLQHAAALAEAMDYATDERLVKKHLNAKAPLHPRRTLDQFYYWTLKDTRTRDRDQVVYRGTAPARDLMHINCPIPNCRHCLDTVKKVARVVMVDQLWMFILDKSTLISYSQNH